MTSSSKPALIAMAIALAACGDPGSRIRAACTQICDRGMACGFSTTGCIDGCASTTPATATCAPSFEALASCYAGATCPAMPSEVPAACATQLAAAQRDCPATTPPTDGGAPAPNRGPEIVACTAGTMVMVGCGGLMIGSCTGDPVLTVCDGSMVSAATCGDPGAAGQLGTNDDQNGLCPGLTVTCPASGMLAVRPTAFGTQPFTCNWMTR